MAIIKVKKRTETEIEVYVAPCIKCGRDEIKIGDCGYSSFNVSFAECKCGNKHTWSCGDSPDFSWIAKEWNKHNDIDTIIADKKGPINNGS